MNDSTPTHWDRTKRLFQAALDLPPERRDAFLRARCGNDHELRAEVESLLCAHDEAEGFLETPPAAAAARLVASGEPAGADDRAGQVLGAYRIERTLGRGGAGTVYLAVRADERFERKVAVKVLRRGVATPEALQRFGSERQILAAIDHPNIARLLDAGTTPDGLPYLVMEHVDGVPVDRYCDRERLSVRERIELFERVCAAVQVAHQSLVVHRDLKPGNILVTPEGVPKLLDFGIAKLLDSSRFPDTGDPTIDEQRLMTPDFASPEQVRGDAITTASDVYSLGVMLYELLTGRRPLELGHLRLGQMERVVLEQTPKRPSAVAREAAPDAAGARRSRPDALERTLAGDLDTILLQALRKEPQRRYGSVEALADDLARYRHGLPVRAVPDTWAYRARKFVGRHRVAVAAAALVIALGCAFTVALARQSVRLAVERDRAAAEAAKARAVAGFLEEILGTADPLQGLGRETTVAGALEGALPRIAETFSEQPDMEAAVRQSVGQTLLGLGRLEEAEEQVAQALEIRRRLHPEVNHPEVAASLNLLGEIRYENDGLEEAEALYAEALTMRRALYAGDHPDLARTVDNLGNIAHDLGDLEEAEARYREAWRMRRRLLGEDHRDVAASLNNLAVLAHDRGDLGRAEELHRQSLAMTRRVLGERHPEVASSLNNLATILHDRGELAAAEPVYREAVAIAREGLGSGHPGLIVNLHNLAVLLEDLSRLDEAETLYREALTMAESTYGPEHFDRLDARLSLAALLSRQDRWEEAEPLYARLVAGARATLPDDSPLVLDLQVDHGLALAQVGDWVRAESLLRSSWEALERLAAAGSDDPDEAEWMEFLVSDIAARIADAYDASGRFDEAAIYRARSAR